MNLRLSPAVLLTNAIRIANRWVLFSGWVLFDNADRDCEMRREKAEVAAGPAALRRKPEFCPTLKLQKSCRGRPETKTFRKSALPAKRAGPLQF